MTRRNKEFKFENGKLLMAERAPLKRVDAGNCPYCELPVYISEGQLLKYLNGNPTHKKCRTGDK